MQRLQFIYNQFGNRNQKKGRENLFKIAERLDHNRGRYLSIHEALNVLREEVDEITEVVIRHEDEQRIKDELFDIISVAVKMLNCEYIIAHKKR